MFLYHDRDIFVACLQYYQHFTTFTPPWKLTKRVYTRPELSPWDFCGLGLRDQSAQKYFKLYLPAYMAS